MPFAHVSKQCQLSVTRRDCLTDGKSSVTNQAKEDLLIPEDIAYNILHIYDWLDMRLY